VLSRSLTRAVPSGRKVMPHGASRPVATVPRTRGRPGREGCLEGRLEGCLESCLGGCLEGLAERAVEELGSPVSVSGCGAAEGVPSPSGSPSSDEHDVVTAIRSTSRAETRALGFTRSSVRSRTSA